MRGDENNLLVQLHNWAHRQDENFTTDSFAHLLSHLVSAAPAVAGPKVKLLSKHKI